MPFVLLLGTAVLLRASGFGNPHIHVDESLYLTIGALMHEGAIPYVDVWDRKPFGLFALYYVFAASPWPVITYQLAATAFAACTALVVRAIAHQFTEAKGAWLAALAYLFTLGSVGGHGGQAPVFYNLFVAAAVLLTLQSVRDLSDGRASWRCWAAMGLCGIAITFKQTAIFESVCLGAFIALVLFRSPMNQSEFVRKISLMAFLGAVPFCAIGAAYAVAGYWPEWFQVMFASNLHKVSEDWPTKIRMVMLTIVFIGPLMVSAVMGIIRLKDDHERKWKLVFLTTWLCAALCGYIAVPNFYPLYALPVLVPLSAIAAAKFSEHRSGLAWFGAVVAFGMIHGHSFQFAQNRESRTLFAEIVKTTRNIVGDKPLLIYDGAPWLYAAASIKPLTPLIFPNHLNQLNERNVSSRNTDEELARVLRTRPYAIMTSPVTMVPRPNLATQITVRDYVAAHCRRHKDLQIMSPIGVRPLVLNYECDTVASPGTPPAQVGRIKQN